MKKTILNGTHIPYDLEISELEKMMSSHEMKQFSLACEALSYKGAYEAYEIMKRYIAHKDKYKRLYVLKTIFRFPYAVELNNVLEAAISSDDFLFVKNGLTVISDYNIKVSESVLILSVETHLDNLDIHLKSLSTLDINENIYQVLVKFYMKSQTCSQREFLIDIMIEKYLPNKAREVFDLCYSDCFAKLRMKAVVLGRMYGFDISDFYQDKDGHIRKFANKSYGKLDFLLKYREQYKVVFSENMESAAIYSTNSNSYIYIEYDVYDCFSEYTLSFSYQHIHTESVEDAIEWIDNIISENIYAIEFFQNNKKRFGGQISRNELSKLTYEYLENFTGYFGAVKLIMLIDSFKIRGFTAKNDIDGEIVVLNDIKEVILREVVYEQ